MKKNLRLLLFFTLLTLVCQVSHAQVSNIPAPNGSGTFGGYVAMLSNGNYVLADPKYDKDGITDVGAVYLHDGRNHAVISKLTGSTADDQVGLGGIVALPNGNFIVLSYQWANGSAALAGAVTWVNGAIGLNGVVSSANSLVGGTANDRVGSNHITVLPGGNYLVSSSNWHNGAAANAGAITWANGSTGISGLVSAGNSLVGTSAEDLVGWGGIQVLGNGNCVVANFFWDNGGLSDAGAVTWINGSTGIAGPVSGGNSLIGSSANDRVGSEGVTKLPNGNYVVRSPSWKNGANASAGAVTWANGGTGLTGPVSSANSLVGTATGDLVGSEQITLLANGNYIVAISTWDNGPIVDAGAVTWGNGSGGTSGVVNSGNSLVGAHPEDRLGGFGSVLALTNGNYVVLSPYWDNGSVIDGGAATWGDGLSGIKGAPNSSNSLVGTTAYDRTGSYGVALKNGNYVVCSYGWNNGAATDAGAVTWGDGASGVAGVVSADNSIVGSSSSDYVGSNGVVALTNGNYVIPNIYWKNGTAQGAGAVTWRNGSVPTSGFVDANNSLVGTRASENIGDGGVTELANGNYVVSSKRWGSETSYSMGAATWANGMTGVSGPISVENSILGSKDGDQIGSQGVIALPNGNYLVISQYWDNGAVLNAGAVTYGEGTNGTVGYVSNSNSLTGSSANDEVGNKGITLLPTGNYLVNSRSWHNGAMTIVGAVTWCNGSTGLTGAVSADNSLIGSSTYQGVGAGTNAILTNGNYVVVNNEYSTWGSGTKGISGVVTSNNSLATGVETTILTHPDGNYTAYTTNSNPITYVRTVRSITLANGVTGSSGALNNCNSVFGGPAIYFAPALYNPQFKYLVIGKGAENTVNILDPLASALANTLDESNVSIAGSGTAALKIKSGCRIIGTIQSEGANPVSGAVDSKVWVESSVPTYGGEPFVARHYQITPELNAGNATGKITLYFTQQEFDDFNAHAGSTLNLPVSGSDAEGISNLRIGKFAGTSGDGTGFPGSYSAGGNSVLNPQDSDISWNAMLNRWEVSFAVAGFSGFVIQTNSEALPVTLISFTGKPVEKDAHLKWKIAEPKNFSHFELERSLDGMHFEMMQKITFDELKTEYEAVDINAAHILATGSQRYYRLKMKDQDGTFTYSKMIAVDFGDIGQDAGIYAYPNPFFNHFSVNLSGHNGETVQVDLRNQKGSVLLRRTITVRNNKLDFDFDESKIPAGIYILHVSSASENIRVAVARK